MTKLKVGMIVIAPEITADYLTPGKEYTIIKVDSDDFFYTESDNWIVIFTRLYGSAHLNGHDWIIKPETTPQ